MPLPELTKNSRINHKVIGEGRKGNGQERVRGKIGPVGLVIWTTFFSMNAQADDLVSSGQFDTPSIQDRRKSVNQRFERIKNLAEHRRQRLNEANTLHQFFRDIADEGTLPSSLPSMSPLLALLERPLPRLFFGTHFGGFFFLFRVVDQGEEAFGRIRRLWTRSDGSAELEEET